MAEKNPFVLPILKWVGGKRQLLDVIVPLIPEYTTYYEPFVGGGAVLFDQQPKKAVINDSNAELINVYNVIKENPEELISKLTEHKEKNTKEYFYSIRSIDRNRVEYNEIPSIEKAARIIYLNRTCFNGLFRVNSSGEFNTPWGKYKNPNITNEVTIRALSKYFNSSNIQILCGDYKNMLGRVKKGAFVYLDPPYMPISSSSSFTGYTANGFDGAEQEELKKQCDKLHKRGVKFLLSNSCCDFIEDLYRDYIVEKVPAKRSINANPDGRGSVDEVLVRNYEIT